MRPKKSKGDEQIDQCHLIRSSGSKDRHSKVCTSKGPRDRRVRLSANTAIDFYDVQDRLGFDRASKAIDWLMKEAKVSIDALACQKSEQKFQEHFPNQIHPQKSESSNPEYDDIQAPSNNFSFISMLCGATPSASIDFCDYPHEHQHSLFSASNPQQYSNGTSNTGWFRRMVTENSNPNGSVNNSSERYSEPILDQAQLFSQREPVDQSSFLPSVCASSNNTQITNIGYHRMPVCKSSSLLTSTGLGCNGVSISPQFQGQEEAINRTSNKSSSASSSFLHY